MAAEVGRSTRSFAGVPEKTYVSRLAASNHDANTVYAAFDNHKNEDFKPYLLKSSGRGKNLDFDCGRSAGERAGAGVCGRSR